MPANLACDKFWVNKNMYHEAEKKYFENMSKLLPNRQTMEMVNEKFEESVNSLMKKKTKQKVGKFNSVDINVLQNELLQLDKENKNEKKGILPKDGKERKNNSEKKAKRLKEKNTILDNSGMTKLTQDLFPKTSLAGEVAKARQHIKSLMECQMEPNVCDVGGVSQARLCALFEKMGTTLANITQRLEQLEKKCSQYDSVIHGAKFSGASVKAPTPPKPAAKKTEEDDDDVDLFGSDSGEEDEEAKKVKEQRLAEYAAKKSKKPAVVAKSNIILDIKPWDDETDMKEMEKAVRAIEMDGLVWGASKLVPVAFKIFKLQISCVVEDDKVSVDILTETLEAIEDYIQSVDIAAFNKV